MKGKLLLCCLVISFLFSIPVSAQTIVFSEDFEVVDSMTSIGNPTWFQDSLYQTNGTYCIRDTILPGDSSLLVSNEFSTLGFNFVILDFRHICKISFIDQGTVEVSNDNGVTWTQLTSAHYLGSSGYFINSTFSSVSYGIVNGWNPLDDLANPDSSWWRHETFDLSSLAANTAQVKIRFKLLDRNFSGSDGNYGWLIDEALVVASPNELLPPYINWSPPLLSGTINHTGPFTISDTITDPSGITDAVLYYLINGGATTGVVMMNTSGNIWQGIIPAVNPFDTVCYFVEAVDAWGNNAILPAGGCNTFVALPGVVLPYNDDFEGLSNLWTPTFFSGSNWEFGAPNFGATSSTHSGLTAWDIDLTAAYQNNTFSTLTSPPINFYGVYNPILSFWRNHSTELNFDGTRLEYTLNNGLSWQILGAMNDPNGVNWYNKATINSSNLPAWAGQSSGWVQSSYRLGCLFTNVSGDVQFRFVFTSDTSVPGDGFSIDDFAISMPSQYDIGVTSIVHPRTSTIAGSGDTVKIVIANFGGLPSSGFDIHYSVNGGLPVSQSVQDTLWPCDIDTLIFIVPFTVPVGSFSICSYTTLSGDINYTNDSMCFNSTGVPFISLPYIDNFDIPPVIWYDSSRVGTSWQFGTPNFGTTNSAHSAPYAWDINLNTTYGNNARSVLSSPFFDFTGIVNSRLTFWQNRKTAANDGMRVEYSIDGGANWTILGTATPDSNGTNWYTKANLNFTGYPGWEGSSNGWINSSYLLPPFVSGSNVQFRFVFISNGSTTLDGISIDDFSLLPGPPVDPGMTSINQPTNSLRTGTSNTVDVTFRNYGSSTLTSAQLTYSINGITTATETWNGSLPPFASARFTFATSFMVPIGTYDICSRIIAFGDADHSNDSICQSHHGIPQITLPYYDSFDTGPSVWVDSSTSDSSHWELGIPGYGQTTGAYSLPNCWDINLDTVYFNNANSYLTSPLFDFTGILNAKLSFRHNYRTELTFDGTRLEYSVNAGNTWSVLGSVGDNLATRWYNRASIASSTLPAWAGQSVDSTTLLPGWIKSTYRLLHLNNAGPDVMFRFVFTSDNSVNNFSGVSVDDFEITIPFPHDVGVTSILKPGHSEAAGTDSVKVIIQNFGLDTTSNFQVSYQINGGSHVNQSYPGTLQPGTADTLTFSTTFTVPLGPFSICSWTSALSDMDRFNDTLCKSSRGFAQDIGITAILQPGTFGIAGASSSVQLVITNSGTDTSVNLPVAYRINSGNVISETVPGQLLPGTSDTITLNSIFGIPYNAYSICAWTAALNDYDRNNDSLCKNQQIISAIFHEDFEVADSMTSGGIAPWFQDPAYHTNGNYCMRDTVSENGTAYLTSNAFSTLGDSYVLLSFDQICKISFADRGHVEVSVDNGNNWTALTGNSYSGGSDPFHSFNYFSSFSYGSVWDAVNDLTFPQNTWWRNELFDLSSVAANYSQVKIRFSLTDGNGNGNSGNYGWLVDNVRVASFNPTVVSSLDDRLNRISVYPNPSSGIFYMEKSDWMKNNSVIVVTDVLGNETWKGTTDKSSFTEIDLSSKPNGVYFVHVRTGSETANQRIVLCR